MLTGPAFGVGNADEIEELHRTPAGLPARRTVHDERLGDLGPDRDDRVQ